jgi:hypothetical protein
MWQWKLNGSLIAGATASSYVATASGNYTCTVTNVCGPITSNTIAVMVNSPPPATISASGPTTFCTGSSVTLNANAGTGLAYQWRLNAVNIPGATALSYSASVAGNYICVVTNACGGTTSNNIIVSVNALPTATITAGGSTTFCTGGSVTLNANTGTGLTYQWKLNGANIAAATTSSYVVGSAGNYTCVVTNSCGNASSNSILVTVNSLPAATITAGGPTTFCAGGSVTLNANSGTGLTYQWKLNGGNIAGATATSYPAAAAGNYSCEVTNTCGGTISNVISVSLLSAPAAPGTISGMASGICGNTASYTIAVVAGATSYNWTVPSGVTINSGQGTAALNVAYPIPFPGGSLSVYAGNTCGTSLPGSITVTSALAPTGTILGLTEVCEMKSYVYSVSSVEGATNYLWTVPAKARVMHGQGTASVEVKMNRYPGNITVTASNACITSATAVLPVTITTLNCAHIHRSEGFLDAEVYPNPSSSYFTMTVYSDDDNPCLVILRDITGRILERRESVIPGRPMEFGAGMANGMYLVEIQQEEERKVIRVVKNE